MAESGETLIADRNVRFDCIKLPKDFDQSTSLLRDHVKLVIERSERERGRNCAKFYIGKSHLHSRRRCSFNPDKPESTSKRKGVSDRWGAHKKSGYHSMVVIAVVSDENLPPSSKGLEDAKQRYALDLEQSLISHFTYRKLRFRSLANTSSHPGKSVKKKAVAFVVYLAIKFEEDSLQTGTDEGIEDDNLSLEESSDEDEESTDDSVSVTLTHEEREDDDLPPAKSTEQEGSSDEDEESTDDSVSVTLTHEEREDDDIPPAKSTEQEGSSDEDEESTDDSVSVTLTLEEREDDLPPAEQEESSGEDEESTDDSVSVTLTESSYGTSTERDIPNGTKGLDCFGGQSLQGLELSNATGIENTHSQHSVPVDPNIPLTPPDSEHPSADPSCSPGSSTDSNQPSDFSSLSGGLSVDRGQSRDSLTNLNRPTDLSTDQSRLQNSSTDVCPSAEPFTNQSHSANFSPRQTYQPRPVDSSDPATSKLPTPSSKNSGTTTVSTILSKSPESHPQRPSLSVTPKSEPSPKPCRCGSFTHQRTNHKRCPWNKKKLDQDPKQKRLTDYYQPRNGGGD